MSEPAEKLEHSSENTAPSYSNFQLFGLFAGPVLFLLIYLFFKPAGLEPKGVAVLAGTAWMATWWITEAAPIPVSSLLPLILFPTLGVAAIKDVAAPYSDPTIYLFLGGMLIAVAIERWNLHRRIALGLISLIGVSPGRLILGFMVSTGVLSAFLSNTATAMMMLPIGLAVISQVVALSKGDKKVVQLTSDGKSVPKSNFGAALMLGIAYAASIGGVATLIGTPPNAVFAGVASKTLGVDIGFAKWMLVGGPLAAIFLVVTWFALLKILPPEIKDIPGGKEFIRGQLRDLGRLTVSEGRVLMVFLLVASLWILRPFVLKNYLPGVDDAMIAVFGGVLLFLIPANGQRGRFLLESDALSKLPWGILLLFGAGFSVAGAFQSSGLAKWIATGLTSLQGVGLFLIILAVVTLMIFLTEVTSNTAIATLFMPIMAAMGAALGVSPLSLMVTAAVAASFAFMLPVATPPNAIVFSTGYVNIRQMARAGIWLNLIGIVVITLVCYYWLPLVWGL